MSMSLRALSARVAPFLATLLGCGAPPEGAMMTTPDASPCAYADAATREDGRVVGGPFATRVVSFTPGEGAGFGATRMPDVVLGPPQGAGERMGSTDVVSLGVRGEIVLGFDHDLVDGPGPDLMIFENAFSVDGDPQRLWAELAEVSVSDDGVTWTVFPCASAGDGAGCAGRARVYSSAASGVCALDPTVSGGDGYDLATVRVQRARFVRIRDLGTLGLMPPASGFDLDAVALLHRAPRSAP